MSEQRTDAAQCFVVDGRIELRRRNIGAERTADLHRADGTPGGRAAAVLIQQFSQADAESALDETAALDVASELYRYRPARAADAEIAIVRRAALKNDRHARERDHIVDDRRTSEQTFDGGQWRADAHFAAAALQALEHRSLFAADVSARAHPHFQIEAPAAAGHVATQVPGLVSRSNSVGQRTLCVRILDSQVNVALGRADGERGDRHAFDQRERIAFHQHAVRERSRITLVCIARHVLLRRRRIENSLPLDTRGKCSSAATTQPRLRDCLHDLLRLHEQRVAQTLVASVLQIVGQTGRLDDARAFERQPLLTGEVRNILDASQPRSVRAVVQEVGSKKPGHVTLGHGSITETLGAHDNLDQGFEPAHAACAIALERQIDAARRCFPSDCSRHSFRPD
jgi:hypothetical protein